MLYSIISGPLPHVCLNVRTVSENHDSLLQDGWRRKRLSNIFIFLLGYVAVYPCFLHLLFSSSLGADFNFLGLFLQFLFVRPLATRTVRMFTAAWFESPSAARDLSPRVREFRKCRLSYGTVHIAFGCRVACMGSL